jgi:hypothetical protein
MRFPGNIFNNIVGSKVEWCELLFITNQPSPLPTQNNYINTSFTLHFSAIGD